jgi:chitin synthase
LRHIVLHPPSYIGWWQLIEPESASPTDAEREKCFVHPEKYDKTLSAYDDVMIRNRRFLGEDRFLTTLALVRGFRSAYEPTAIARTKAMDSMIGLIKQRRRWDNSTLANALYLFKELFALGSNMRRSTRFVVGLNLLDTAFSLISPAFIYLLLYFFFTGVLPLVPTTVWHAVLSVVLVVVGFAHFVPGWNLGASQLAYMSVIGNMCLLTAGASIYLMARLALTVAGQLGEAQDTSILVLSVMTQAATVGSVLLSLAVHEGWLFVLRSISGIGSLLMLAFHNWFMKFYAVGNLHDLTWGTRGLDTGEDRTNVKISFLAALVVFTANAGFLVMFFIVSASSEAANGATNTFTLTIGLIMCITTAFSALVRLGFALYRVRSLSACASVLPPPRLTRCRVETAPGCVVRGRAADGARRVGAPHGAVGAAGHRGPVHGRLLRAGPDLLPERQQRVLLPLLRVQLLQQHVDGAQLGLCRACPSPPLFSASLVSPSLPQILSAVRCGLMVFCFFMHMSLNRGLFVIIWVLSFFLIAAHGVYELRPGQFSWETAPWAVCMVTQLIAVTLQTIAFGASPACASPVGPCG